MLVKVNRYRYRDGKFIMFVSFLVQEESGHRLIVQSKTLEIFLHQLLNSLAFMLISGFMSIIFQVRLSSLTIFRSRYWAEYFIKFVA